MELRRPCREGWAVVDDVVWTRVGGLLAPPKEGGCWVRTQGGEAADPVNALNGRRRAPWEPLPVDGRWTSPCSSCGLPQARVEWWDGRACDECWRGICIRPFPVREHVPEQPPADPQRERREEIAESGRARLPGGRRVGLAPPPNMRGQAWFWARLSVLSCSMGRSVERAGDHDRHGSPSDIQRCPRIDRRGPRRAVDGDVRRPGRRRLPGARPGPHGASARHRCHLRHRPR